jgi:hypothetical protein
MSKRTITATTAALCPHGTPVLASQYCMVCFAAFQQASRASRVGVPGAPPPVDLSGSVHTVPETEPGGLATTLFGLDGLLHDSAAGVHVHPHLAHDGVDSDRDGVHSHPHVHSGDAAHSHVHEPGLRDSLMGPVAVPDPGGSDVGRVPPWVSGARVTHAEHRGWHTHAHNANGDLDHDGSGFHSHSHEHAGDAAHVHDHGGLDYGQAAQAGGVPAPASSSGRRPDTSWEARRAYLESGAFAGVRDDLPMPSTENEAFALLDQARKDSEAAWREYLEVRSRVALPGMAALRAGAMSPAEHQAWVSLMRLEARCRAADRLLERAQANAYGMDPARQAAMLDEAFRQARGR